MLQTKNYLIFILAGLLIVCSTVSLAYFWGGFAKKTPVRAKQVFFEEKSYPGEAELFGV